MNIYLALAIMAFGLALHLGKKMMEFEDAGDVMSPLAYARKHPWRIFVTVGSCIGGVFVLDWWGQLNHFAAFSTGFSASSVFDMLRSRSNAKLQAIQEKGG